MAAIVDAILEHREDGSPAVDHEGHVTTYRELVELTRRVTAGLQRRLPDRGDLCLVVSHPGLEESLALTLAGWSMGLRVATLPPHLTDRELQQALRECAPVFLVSAKEAGSRPSLNFSALSADAPAAMPRSESAARTHAFTSDARGGLRCVDRAVSRLAGDVEQLVAATGLSTRDRVTTLAGADLSTTSVLPALCAGAAVVPVEMRSTRGFWTSVEDRSVTVISGTPYTYELASRARPDRERLAGVRLALSASARLRPATVAAILRDTGVAVRNVLCSSEAGHVTYNSTDDPGLLARSVGTPLPGVEVEIRGPDGAAVPDGTPGVLRVRSPFAAGGYRHDPAGTAAVFRDGWVVSADVGYRDRDGFLHLIGRDDHTIHVGAVKLDPRELEDVLREHPAVSDALVVGERHARLGQVPVARVVARDPATPQDLLTHCRHELSSGKVPQRIEFVREIPRDGDGRPVRPEFVRFADAR